MPDILLTTLNARYAHAAFGLRYLLANLPPAIADRAEILEFDIAQRPVDVLEAILARSPRIVGVGVYIWNVEQATKLVADLKRVRPDVVVIVGGPEVSFEIEEQEICRIADHVIAGEADMMFGAVCERILRGERVGEKIIQSPLPQFELKAKAFSPSPGTPGEGRGEGFGENAEVGMLNAKLNASAIPRSAFRVQQSPDHLPAHRERGPMQLPYHFYTDEDLRHRVVYVEASRGCPFKCEFCLSSLDVPLRNVPLNAFLAEMQKLLDRGLRQFKFVDRTFNLNLNISRAILDFFRVRYTPGLFLHFEMIPDRLPEALREPIRGFPAGALQFEVGIQSFNEEVCDRISRRQDTAKVEENLRWLRSETGVHVHADLIVGLPGEDLESFAAGFDRLVALRPQEIQVGILKRLRGTPIVRHDVEWQMVYSPHPPYEILSTKTMDFATIQRMRRFARYWDLIANSGNFVATTPLLWRDGSPFKVFLAFSDWLFTRIGRNHAIALNALAEQLFEYLTQVQSQSPADVAPILWNDYRQDGRRDGPDFLRNYIPEEMRSQRRRNLPTSGGIPSRGPGHAGAVRPE